MSQVAARDAEADLTIARIMEEHGVRVSLSEFHAAVNVTFHEFESESYDIEHADMWESVPRQINLLADDCVPRENAGQSLPDKIRLLDIGCGTGLATDSLLKSEIGRRICSVDLLDTSPAMLKQARKRSSQWSVPVSFHEGLLESLGTDVKYDWIITCSVLHHVPHLQSFTEMVRGLQAPGGVFLHVQDPNGDFLADPELNGRMARRTRFAIPESLRRLAPRRIATRLVRELTGKQPDDPVSRTNRALLDRGVLATPMTASELFAITDIHVQNRRGVSGQEIRTWRPDWELVSCRSYGFFGELWSTLPPVYRRMEEELIRNGAPNGFHIGAAWRWSPAGG